MKNHSQLSINQLAAVFYLKKKLITKFIIYDIKLMKR